jgi:hypothetical protein
MARAWHVLQESREQEKILQKWIERTGDDITGQERI